VRSHTGPNAVSTTWQVDSLGRTAKELRADGTEIVTNRYTCGAGGVTCPTGGKLKLLTEQKATSAGTSLRRR
jgi:hypothetical protein